LPTETFSIVLLFTNFPTPVYALYSKTVILLVTSGLTLVCPAATFWATAAALIYWLPEFCGPLSVVAIITGGVVNIVWIPPVIANW